MRRGLYRVHGTEGRPDDVRIVDDGIETPVDEQLYRTRGYEPPVENLPWEEDYFRKKPSPEAASRSTEAGEKAAREQARQEFRTRFRNP